MRKSLLKRLTDRSNYLNTTDQLRFLIRLSAVVAGLMLPAYAFALGLGNIHVHSALGQPLKADIELVSASKAERTSLIARIGSPDIYKGAGLEYPYGNKFTFKIEHRANGDAYIQASSAQSINDPFVSLLVELTWSSGKLLREYTFLLDPPGYVADQPAPIEVQAVAPAVQAAPQPHAVKPEPQPAPVAEVVRQLEAKPVKPSRIQVAAEPAAKNVASGDIVVNRGDTLRKIAMENKPAEISLERMLVALYRANATQFDAQNMNRIQAGKILRLPEQAEIQTVSQSDAVKEIRAQVVDWNAYRQKLAGAATLGKQSEAAQQATSGKISSSVAEKTPVAQESAKEVLKLSKGEVPGDKAAAGMGQAVSAQDKKNAAQEDAIAKSKAIAEEKSHAAMLENNLKDMQRLAQLKSEAAALAQSSGVVAASSVPAVTPKPKPLPKVAVPEPSLLDQILMEPAYLAGVAAAVLGLGGLGLMLYRRRQSSVGGHGDVGVATGKITTPVTPSPDTGDFTSAAGIESEESSPVADDAVDPISEADLFLNFGRDVQAEEILKEALQNTPDNHQIHLKLLGIYANRKDVNSFAGIARQLQDSGDDEAWQQAATMGRKLEPGNPMYGGGADIEDVGSATTHTAALDVSDAELAIEGSVAEPSATEPPAIDFDLDAPAAAAPEVDFNLDEPAASVEVDSDQNMSPVVEQDVVAQEAFSPSEDTVVLQPTEMDFDVTSTNPSLPAASEMDFDITGANAVSDVELETEAATEPALPNLDDLVFDINPAGSSITDDKQADEMSLDKQDEPVVPEEDTGMAFTLDLPAEAPITQAPLETPAETALSEISLNLDDAPDQEASTAAKDDHWHEVATKFDLAKAYQEMGDATGAREILEEVMREGDEEQRAAAQALIDKLS